MKAISVLLAIVFLFCVNDVFATAKTSNKKSPASSAKNIASAKLKLKKELYRSFGKEEIDGIFSDDRLEIYQPKAGGGKCSYFDPCFGLLSDRALATGFDFWSRNKEYFEKAKDAYGVDADVILGVIRIETYFGRGLGKQAVFNTLYGTYVLSPEKRKGALKEMKAFLKIAENNGWDVFEIVGSTAGAFGIPQFMPSSYSLAADGDGDNVVDLFNEADAIMSVAKYLKSNGWGKSIDDKKLAVWAYNHDNSYANAVLIYARVISLCKLEKPPTH